MSKISEMPENRIELEDVLYFTDNKCNPRNTTLGEIMDKYAIEFAYYLTDTNVCTGQKSVEELLNEFKKSYFEK